MRFSPWAQAMRFRLGTEGQRARVETLIGSVKKALLVFAHMDDEINACGLLSRLKRLGACIDVMVLTDGAANPWTDARVVGPRTHFECRRDELYEAMRLLGLREAVLPAFPDSKLSAHLSLATQKVAEEIEQRRPELVLTFDSRGINGHPDHIAAHQAAVEALRRTSFPSTLAMLLPPPPFSWALGAGFRSNRSPTVATLNLSEDELEQKCAVFEAYRSQRKTLRALTAGLPPRTFFRFFRSEWFLWLTPGEARKWVERS